MKKLIIISLIFIFSFIVLKSAKTFYDDLKGLSHQRAAVISAAVGDE